MREKIEKLSCSIVIAIVVAGSLAAQRAHAWGERGHHVICMEATRLVKEAGLKGFLKTRGELMGHVCNIPDIDWRSLPANVSGIGNPTHFFEPDLEGIAPKDVPTTLPDFLAMLAPHGDPQKLIQQTGSLWWRAEQFSKNAIDLGTKAAASPLPVNSLEEQSNALPYNQNVYDMMTNMGLLGHFVGDASMPYHNTGNYDGWQNGHGGLHAFYESTCPSEYESDLNVEVRAAALVLRSHLPVDSEVLPIMKFLSTAAYAEIPLMEKLDKVLKPSTVVTNDQGMSIRTPAERQPPAQQCARFRPLIVFEMAKSAKALAQMWDQIYIKSGRPNLDAYKSYRYPLAPDFIAPDYLAAHN